MKNKFTLHVDSTGLKWTSSVENVQKLPKLFDHGKKTEIRMISAMYPGADGIGCDIYEKIYSRNDENFDDCIARIVGAPPVLEALYGEEYNVIYAGSHRAKVKRFDPNKDSAEIEFEDKTLIPPTMWVGTVDLHQVCGGRVINTQTHCPKCEIRWKETMLARFSVWDCPGCGAKKEDYVS